MPFMLTAGTFLIYMAVHGNDLDNQLTAVNLFMTMSLYGILQVPLGFLPMLINFLSAVRMLLCSSAAGYPSTLWSIPAHLLLTLCVGGDWYQSSGYIPRLS